MSKTVKVRYQADAPSVEITVGDKTFDTTRIEGRTISDWAYPFIVQKIRWNGFYEEMKAFLNGEEEFYVRFEGDEKSLSILKNALNDTAAKVAGTDNKVVILYNSEPLSTKITINGKVFDTSRLDSRSISDWIFPFQFQGASWDGIYKELEKALNTNEYAIQFVGEPQYMKELMDECPGTVSITCRAPMLGSSNNTRPMVEKISMDNLKQTMTAQNISELSGQMLDKVKQTISDEEIDKNIQNIPIKNTFIQKNAITLCAALSILFAAFPFVKFTTESDYTDPTNVVMNGFSALFGSNGTIISIILFLGPILLIVMNYIKQLKPFRRVISVAVPAVCTIFELITVFALHAGFKAGSDMTGAANDAMVGMGMDIGLESSFSLQIGFFLILLSYILTAAIGLMTYYGLKLPSKKS